MKRAKAPRPLDAPPAKFSRGLLPSRDIDVSEEPPPVELGPYRIEGEIGHGGMGIVYRGVDTRLQRPVAIKVLPAALAGDDAGLARFDWGHGGDESTPCRAAVGTP